MLRSPASPARRRLTCMLALAIASLGATPAIASAADPLTQGVPRCGASAYNNQSSSWGNTWGDFQSKACATKLYGNTVQLSGIGHEKQIRVTTPMSGVHWATVNYELWKDGVRVGYWACTDADGWNEYWPDLGIALSLHHEYATCTRNVTVVSGHDYQVRAHMSWDLRNDGHGTKYANWTSASWKA